jgi:purine-binding chemotaxis protein CheW
MQPRSAVSARQFTVFTIGELEYAVDIMRISRIIRSQTIRPVPQAPAYIDGVIELRGVVIPIIDLRSRFGLEPVPPTRATKQIIVQVDDRLVGFVVDEVVGMVRVEQSAIRPTPEWIAGPEAAIFSGLCRREDHLVLLVNLKALISSKESFELGALQLDSDKDWSAEATAVEVVEAGGVDVDVDDWWESD